MTTRPFESVASMDLRDCRLYRFWVAHPDAGRRVLGYVGETVRVPFARLMEHIAAQPWADLMIAWEVDGRTFPGKEAVLTAERSAVEIERPLFNVEFNRSNPHRITREQATAQRWARDDAAARPRWTPQPQRGATGPIGQQPAGRQSAGRQWKPWQIKVALWAAALVLLWLGFWRLTVELGATFDHGAGIGGVGSAALLIWGIRRRPARCRRRR